MKPGFQMVLVDFGGNSLVHAELVACAAAETKQLQQHVALPPPFGWGISGTMRAAAGPTDVHPDELVIALLSHADQAGALGYHSASPHGRPYAKCFPLLDKQDGSYWQQTVSHEAIELACDPEINVILQSPDGTLWAAEQCDACERGIVMIDGVPLSDFILPPWYGAGTGHCNWLGTLHPGEVGPGGYAQKLDPTRGWVSIEHSSVRPRAYRSSALGRRDTRQKKHLARTSASAIAFAAAVGQHT